MDLLAAIVGEEEQKGRSVMIVGDFNADLRRTNQNDRRLERMVNQNNLVARVHD